MGLNTHQYSRSITPQVTAGAYLAGHCIGGLMRLQNFRAGDLVPRRVKLQDIFVIDLGNNLVELDIIVFAGQPLAGTYNDHAALALSTDVSRMLGILPVAVGFWRSVDAKSFATMSGYEFLLERGEEIWIALVAVGAPTYGSAADLTLKFRIEEE